MYIQYFQEYYDRFPILIKIVWWLIGVVVFCILSLTLFLLSRRLFLRKKENSIAESKKEFEVLLVRYLNANDEQGESQISEIRSLIKNKVRRKTFISILFKLMNEVSGEISDSIRTLYHKTGLIHFALGRLKSMHWHVVAKAIGELTRFKVHEIRHEVEKFINHPRKEVRTEAQLYLTNLFGFDGLSFLNILVEPLSEWEQICLLETLGKFEDQQIGDIRPWLNSRNVTVVLFALKLAQIHSYSEGRKTFMELQSHPAKKIRIKVIEVLMDLYGAEAKKILKGNFDDLSIEEQISFFVQLEKLLDLEDEPFVQKHLFHENFEIQLSALEMLKSINMDKYQTLMRLPISIKTQAMLKHNNK